MTDITLALDGMRCTSCEKLIMRAAESQQVQVTHINIPDGLLTFSCNEEKLEAFKAALREKGFTEKTADARNGELERGSYARVYSFALNIIGGRKEFAYEAALFNTSLLALLMLSIGIGALFFLNIVPRPYLPLALLSVVGSVALTYTYTHATSYRGAMSCMNGMMSGMTLGMIGGFLAGLLIGATNGMFIGSIAGMLVGIKLGLGSGRLCGVMGAMEGIMGGFMAGIMGAMTSVMMLNDNMLLFIYISFGIGVVILGGLSYMFYREGGVVAQPRTVRTDVFVMAALQLALFLILVMLYAPKGPLTFI